MVFFEEGDVMTQRIVALVGCFLALTACSKKTAETDVFDEVPAVAEWQIVAPADMTETQKAQQELCLTAVNAMAAETLGELEAALEAGDPAEAITVCREKAPAIADHIATQYGIKIGRTSYKLRNPANVPPEWADELVAEHAEEPAFLVGPNGELGALLPIRLKAECQMCHGPADAIDEEILAAVAENYPDDQAVGFVEGDLRGWFWVQAPPGQTEES
jgi:hypothetical protein